MVIFITFALISAAIILGIFRMEGYVDKLPDSNKFKKWWRRNIIDNAPEGLDI